MSLPDLLYKIREASAQHLTTVGGNLLVVHLQQLLNKKIINKAMIKS